MKQFLRRISPKRAVVDLAEQWRQPTPHRWPILGVAIAGTFAMFMLFIPDSQRIEPRRPDVIFISTWEDGRSEAEIIASNCANQQLKDELQAKLDQRAEIGRDMYRALGRATFIDVDAMEAEIAAERAAEEAAAGPRPSDSDVGLSVEEYCARAAG
ncbi:hypothetical protein GCM10009127_10470 [Alteraurantiacibacter aestuarii]|uniref:Uncharacterized protein n=1 Tax=Alteraurantiacibacter aestuarii TaxID=650004 RepID=A0A844ZIM9_9SPHN|nr:hypothetical protein [Alteraurantiacibacter aestuarii]MXO87434.1 hypothetical protein [Alteraurantiacibacter aestuarii]